MNKIKQTPLKTYIVPEKNMKKFLELFDNSKKGTFDRYIFWCYVAEMFPDVKQGTWELDLSSVWSVKICEKLP